MTYATIDLTVSDALARLTLNRPDQGNPFDGDFCSDLCSAANQIASRGDVRAVLLRAHGKFFSVGGDIEQFSRNLQSLPESILKWTADLHMGLVRLARLDAPIVACVHATAMGGAVALVANCDLVFGGRSARFGAAYSQIGYSCDAGSSFGLASRMGLARARRFLLLNEMLDAQAAAQTGLVDYVVEDATLVAEAEDAAIRLSRGPTRAYGEIRRLLRRAFAQPFESQLEEEAQGLMRAASTLDAQEGIAAFVQKRKPQFVGLGSAFPRFRAHTGSGGGGRKMWLFSEIKSLADIPRHYARTLPDKVALIGATGTRTFRELDAESSRLGAAIVAAGIPARSHIGFIGKNSTLFFELLFGAAKANCALTPLNWRLAVAELCAVVEDAQCPIVFVEKDFAPTLDSVQRQCSYRFVCVRFDSTTRQSGELDAWIAAAGPVDPQIAIAAEDTALLLYTSGTTGRPKGVQITHQGLGYMRLCEHLEPALQWQQDDVVIMVMPNFHLLSPGLAMQALYNGSTVSILPVLDPGATLKVIQRDRPTICVLVPTAIQMLLDHPDAAITDFSCLRLVMYAGSPISSTLLQRALREMRCRFMQFYGATESSGAITLLRPEQHDVNDEARLRSCGTPLPLIEIRIVDATGRDVPQGTTGEFWVRAPSLFGGYWNQPGATAEVMREGWYRTGDAGYRDASGLLYIVDRVKDMIVTGGENVYSGEVEQALQKHPGVRASAVIGVPDARWGEMVTAVVVPAAGLNPTAEELITHCRNLIASYKVPKVVHFVDTLPMTATGKVLKRAVRDQFWKSSVRAVG